MIMTWFRSPTQSLPMATLMHTSFTGSQLELYRAASFTQGLNSHFAFELAPWTAVAVAWRRSPIRSNVSVRRLSDRADIGQSI